MKFGFRVFAITTLFLCIHCSGSKVLTEEDVPQLFIVSPLDNSKHLEGDNILFTVAILDGKDRGFVGSEISWFSSVDGEIGTGEKFKIDNLSENNHLIIVKATNNFGGESEDTISLNIRFNNSPLVIIESPIENSSFNYTENIVFKGNVTDIEDGVIDDSSLVWMSDIDSIIGYGDSCSFSSLTDGHHSISLTATDKDGFTTTAQMNIIVSVTFEKTFGTVGSDYGYAVIETSDKGFVVSGKTALSGADSYDASQLKLKSNGVIDWKKIYGGVARDNLSSLAEVKDGGFAAVGSTYSFGNGGSDVYFLRTDVNGSVMWERTYGRIGDDFGYNFTESSDGDFVIVGTTINVENGSTDLFLVKLNSGGYSIWERIIRRDGRDLCTSICEVSDGGFIITGWTTSYNDGEIQAYLLKINTNGIVVWEKTFGGSKKDVGTSVVSTPDGGSVLFGWSASFGNGDTDLYLLKISPLGELEWEKTYGGSGDDVGTSICRTYDNGFIMTGSTKSVGAGNSDLYLLKVDANGNLLWEKTFGGSEKDFGESVCETSDRGFIVTGYTNSFTVGVTNLYLIKTDSLGNVNEVKR